MRAIRFIPAALTATRKASSFSSCPRYSRTRIGKEITVDPTDSDEDFTAEMLSATDVLQYRSPAEKLEVLRAAVEAAGIKRIARTSGVPRSQLQAL
jgi:hypothetical protein